MAKPLIAITMGDGAGVGPEIIMKVHGDDTLFQSCRPLVIGDAQRLREAGAIVGSELEVDVVDDPQRGDPRRRSPVPRPHRAARRAHGDRGGLDDAHHSPAHGHPRHHPHRADRRHRADRPGLVYRTIKRGHEAMRNALDHAPRIAVCGINPHAGEHGLFGRGEEEGKIQPAVQRAADENVDVQGPLPADTVFFRAVRGDFDLVVAMYHDQGHGPIKALSASMPG